VGTLIASIAAGVVALALAAGTVIGVASSQTKAPAKNPAPAAVVQYGN
jgi:hypothetical protein